MRESGEARNGAPRSLSSGDFQRGKSLYYVLGCDRILPAESAYPCLTKTPS